MRERIGWARNAPTLRSAGFGALAALLAAVCPGDAPTLAGTSFARVVRQGPTGATLEVRVPQRAYAIGVDDAGRRTVTLEGLGSAPLPGRPELPLIVTSFAVPEGAILRVSWTEGPESQRTGPPIRRVPSPVAERYLDPATSVAEAGDADIGAGVWPTRRVAVEELRFRDLRIARVSVYPARYAAATRELLLVSELDIELSFEGGRGFKAPPRGSPERDLAARLANRATLLNAPAAPSDESAEASAASRSAAAPATVPAALPGVKIRVAEEGLVRVDRALLEAAGFSPAALDALDPRNLQLSFRGTPVPCRVVGEEDGSFDAGDAVEFYGVPATSRFFEANTYWLSEQVVAGARFVERDATPSGAPAVPYAMHAQRFEGGNSIYTYGEPAAEGDPHFFWVWFEDSPTPPRVTAFALEAHLPGPVAPGPPATLRALFRGRTDPPGDPDHRVRFRVNGDVIGESAWSGAGLHAAEVAFDSQLLVAGDNTLELEYLPTAIVDVYYMDWIEVQYPRALTAAGDALLVRGADGGPRRYEVSGFQSTADAVVLDVTDPLAPVELTGLTARGAGTTTLAWQETAPDARRYLAVGDGGRVAPVEVVVDAPSSLRDPSNGADLIVVVPEGWEDALAPLVADRRSRGLRVVLANLTDAADEFAGGNADDLALRDFVAWAYSHWQAPAPSFLLLVGEPNLDPTNQMQSATHHHLMPTHFGVTAALGETMSDTWFGAVSGADPLPDLAVGRLSVRRATAAAALVDKILAYEAAPTGDQAWTRNVVQVAANHVDFERSLEASAAWLPAGFTVDRQYRLAGADAASIQDAVGAGALLLSFTGHGNVAYWADKPGGAFFTTTSVSGLGNAGRLPLVTAMNCLNGLLGHPTIQDSLAEQFVDPPELGAIAMWSPSAFGFLVEYEALQSNLYRTLFGDHQPVMGTATTLALVETYLTEPVSADLLTEMVFVGDPAGFLVVDADGDGPRDFDELRLGSDPGDRDTDDDGLPDGQEADPSADGDADGRPGVLDPDSDNDGLPDGLEAGIAAPDGGTDTSRGFFRPDADPASTTDPADADSDGGGAPDGAEDRNADGAVDGTETDPRDPADDPVCSAAAPPEIASLPQHRLRLDRAGGDVVLAWGAASDDPCLLFRVYVADDLAAGTAGFALRAVTASPAYADGGAASDGRVHRYLVVGATPAHGEGPWGHE